MKEQETEGRNGMRKERGERSGDGMSTKVDAESRLLIQGREERVKRGAEKK